MPPLKLPISTSSLLRRLHPPPPTPVTPFRRYAFSPSFSAAAREQKSRRTLAYLVGVACAMVGASYAAVPLYRRFCQATGYGGTVQRRETVEEKIARHSQEGTTTSREIVVQFNADVADGMQWKFTPTQREAGVYFNKIQCFCFEEQRLLPGEQIDMPVFFYIDPEFETDPKMDSVNGLILSYTFFNVKEEQ